MKNLYYACRIEDIPALTGKRIYLQGKNIALFKNKDQIFAVLNRCPHQGAELSDGYIKDGTIYCALHGWSFYAQNGEFTLNSNLCLKTFNVLIKEEKVFIQFDKEIDNKQ